MSAVSLCIGSKNLSSWSLRPWLLLRHHNVPFKEVCIELDRPETRSRILEHSPSGRVPVLLHGRVRVWESLAICEYVAETFALPAAWPLEPEARAFARSAAQEMHAGFADLRRELPFDATRDPAPTRVSAAAQHDIDRVRAIWREARSRYGWKGEWLCGHFGIVDAMFAPVALRLYGYAIDLDGVEAQYVRQVLQHPAVQQWIEGAAMTQPAAARVVVAEEAAPEAPQPVAAASAPRPEPVTAPAPAPEPEPEPESVAAPALAMAVAPQPTEQAAAEKAPTKKPAANKSPEQPRRLRSFILPSD